MTKDHFAEAQDAESIAADERKRAIAARQSNHTRLVEQHKAAIAHAERELQRLRQGDR